MFNIYDWKSCHVWRGEPSHWLPSITPSLVTRTTFVCSCFTLRDFCVLRVQTPAVGRTELCWSSQCTTHTIRTKLCHLSLSLPLSVKILNPSNVRQASLVCTHNLAAVLASKKLKAVSSHWLDAGKAPDCTCRKSIKGIKSQPSLPQIHQEEKMSASFSERLTIRRWVKRAGNKRRKKGEGRGAENRLSSPAQLRSGIKTSSWVMDSFSPGFCCHSSHAARVKINEDTGAVVLKRMAHGSLATTCRWQRGGFKTCPTYLTQSRDGHTLRIWRGRKSLRFSSSSCESKCQQESALTRRCAKDKLEIDSDDPQPNVLLVCWLRVLWLSRRTARSRMWEETASPPGRSSALL